MFKLSDNTKKKICGLWLWDSQKRKEYRASFTELSHFSTRYINFGQYGSDVILNELKKNKPCLISRFGSTELTTIQYFYEHKKLQKIHFPQYIKDMIKFNSGFFSNSDDLLTKFCCDALQILPNIDVFATWCHRQGFKEQEIFEAYNKHAQLTYVDSLVSVIYHHKQPWTQYLKGKKVLVIHPFKNTIEAQYQKREKLFDNPLVLPQFDLKVLKTVQGLGNNNALSQYEDWFDALQSMYRQIDECDFDIALVAGGAFGMFLANYIKNMGKQAVQTAGATQLLFGIIGSRWIEDYGKTFTEGLVNEHWVYPFEEDTPKGLDEFIANENSKTYW